MADPGLSALPDRARVLIVGAGFAGLAMAIRLLRAGYDRPDDVVVIDRGDEVGGTWRDNTYPGAAVDVPTALYSYSFAPSAQWSRSYARQPELLRYLRTVADEHGIRPHLLLGTTLESAGWDAEDQSWEVRTDRGTCRARVLVAATGTLSEPRTPALPGLAEFRGPVFHSARWRADVPLTDRRVAVVGTGASAVQFVPAIAPVTGHVTVFQRSPAWVIPRGDRQLSRLETALYGRVPASQRLARGALYAYRESYVFPMAHHPQLLARIQRGAEALLARTVTDERLRARLTPDYTIACKRLLLSNDYLPTLTRPDVTVTSAAVAVTPEGVTDADGVTHPADVIVFGTGFQPTEPPVARLLTGTGGRTLAEVWDGSPQAYRGTTVHGFPNLFLMYGPNTNLGHTSIVYMLESQATYVADAVRALDAYGYGSLEVRADAQAAYNEKIQTALSGTVWNVGGCDSWYLDRTGRNTTMWPTYTWLFRRGLRRIDLAAYEGLPRVAPEGRRGGAAPSNQSRVSSSHRPQPAQMPSGA